jgi:DNA-binding PadR family transcriptional regulator
MLWHVILGLLRDGELHHGYELMTAFRVRSGGPASPGNFYRELGRLQTHGLVETALNPPDADARRIPYHITEKDRGSFDRWLLAPPMNEGDLAGWLLFVGRVPLRDRDRLLDRWQEELWVRSQELARQHRAAVDAAAAAVAHDDYEPLRVLLSRQLKHLAADLAFLEDLRSDLKTWAARGGGISEGGAEAREGAADVDAAGPASEALRRAGS